MSVETIDRDHRSRSKKNVGKGSADRRRQGPFPRLHTFPFENGDHLSMYSIVQALLKITSTTNPLRE